MPTIRRVLRSVPDVSEIRRIWFSEQRVLFRLHGEECEIWEPFGDNSRYWISPSNAKSSKLNLSELHAAFAEYSDRFTSAIRRVAGLLQRSHRSGPPASPN
jgi:hypothetical protein